MTKQQKHKISQAAREAITDTFIGTMINFPLNAGMMTLAFAVELTAIQASLMFTGVFTIMAIIRKMLVRLHFAKKQAA
jgi:hypothetical protein